MAPERHTEAEDALPRATSAADPTSERALFDRVQASPELSRSPRLRQLFEYLYERSVSDPGAPLTEERIGVDVFGRTRGYDTGSDTIVRVQISQLRRKLEHYFLSEGAAEPVIIDLPKRSYAPVFRVREQPIAPEKEPVEPVKEPVHWRRSGWGLTALAAVCLVAVGWLLLENNRLSTRASLGAGRMPFRDHFW